MEITNEMIINGNIKAEFCKTDSESELENFIQITDLDTKQNIKFHYTALKLLKQLLNNRNLK